MRFARTVGVIVGAKGCVRERRGERVSESQRKRPRGGCWHLSRSSRLFSRPCCNRLRAAIVLATDKAGRMPISAVEYGLPVS